MNGMFARLYRKELLQYLWTPSAYILAAVFLLLCGYAFATPLFLVNQATLSAFTGAAPVLLAFLLPALTMRLFAEEKRSGTMELLLSSPADDWQVLLSKYCAALTVCAAILALTLVYPLCVLTLGDLDTGVIACTYAGLFLTGALFTAAGLFASAFAQSQMTAFILGFLFSFALAEAGAMSRFLSSAAATLADFAGVESHLSALARGTLDSRDLLYYAAAIFVFLLFTRMQLARMRSTSGGELTARKLSPALIALACAAILSLASGRFHFRLDFTRDRVYSISSGTKNILAPLDKPLLFTVYASKDLPAPIAATKEYLLDLLREYVAAGNGRISVRLVETEASGPERGEAMRVGILPVQFDIFSDEKYESREGFLGLAINFSSKKSVIPYVARAETLEYEITSKIQEMCFWRDDTVGLISARGSASPVELSQEVLEKLTSRYGAVTIDLSPGQQISKNITAAILVGPREKLTEPELRELDRFLLSGGTLAIAADPAEVDHRSFKAKAIDDGLEPLLNSKGIRRLPGMAVDEQSQAIQIARQVGTYTMKNVVRYPPFIVSTALGDTPASRGLSSLIFPFTYALEITTAAPKSNVLARASAKSSVYAPVAGEYDTSPFTGFKQNLVPKPSVILAAETEGMFAPMPGNEAFSGERKSGKLIYLGSSRMFMKEYGLPEENLLFLLNAADWMKQKTELLAIRSRAAGFRPLTEIPSSGKKIAKYACIFAPPLLAALCGLLIHRFRVRAWRRYERQFAVKKDA